MFWYNLFVNRPSKSLRQTVRRGFPYGVKYIDKLDGYIKLCIKISKLYLEIRIKKEKNILFTPTENKINWQCFNRNQRLYLSHKVANYFKYFTSAIFEDMKVTTSIAQISTLSYNRFPPQTFSTTETKRSH